MAERMITHVWESSSFGARLARAALRPLSWVYAFGVAVRNAAYDHGMLRARPLALPSVSVGNLTVGGTGKTPIAAFIARRFEELGLKPAIVMRGFGGDEPIVHARLNPSVLVAIGADRGLGVRKAREAGRNVVVLDDAFQHRRARRDADIVLLAADLAGPVRSLPAGPWREPLTSLSRATLIVVTRKSASLARARDLLAQVRQFAPQTAAAIIHLAPDGLVAWTTGQRLEISGLRDKSVFAIAGIGDPRSFARQLGEAGARVELAAEPDHHAYTAAEAAALARRAGGFDLAVCTLKDAVKLGPVWPREAPPLWYLSQRVEVESGAADLDRILTAVAGLQPTN